MDFDPVPMTLKLFDEDPMTDINNVTQFYELIKSTYETLDDISYVMSDVEIFLNCLVILFDLYLIVIILRKEELKPKFYQYVLHYCVHQIGFLFSASLFFKMMILSKFIIYIRANVYVVILKLKLFTFVFMYMFPVGIGIEWLCFVNNPNLGHKSKLIHDYSITILYLIGCCLFLIIYYLRYYTYYIWLEYIFTKIVYFLILSFITVCKYLQYRQNQGNNKNSYMLTTAGILVYL